MTIYQILTLIGIPGLMTVFIGFLTKAISKIQKENGALKLGMQALLRAQMIDDYHHYKEKGFAPIYAKENFENCWIQYEALGKNGVMSGIHDEFMQLPVKGKDEKIK